LPGRRVGGETRQSIIVAKTMDARVKRAHDKEKMSISQR
jgi:hypothetical protein